MPENNTETNPSFDDTYQAVHHLAEVAAQAEKDIKEGKRINMPQLLNDVKAFSDSIPEARDVLANMEAADLTRTKTMATLTPQLRMNAENYSEGIKDWNKLHLIKDDVRRNETEKKIPKDRRQRMNDAATLHAVMLRVDEGLKTELAEEEIRVNDLERELFADLEGTIKENGSEAIEYGNQSMG